MTRNRLFTRSSLLLAAMMLLSACTGAAPQPTAAPAATQATGATKAPEATSAPAATTAPQTGQVKDVPREKTYVVTLWSDTGGAIPGFDNWNPLMNAGSLRNNGGNAGLSEGLFYRDLNNGQETPWLGESYDHNANFTQWTIKLRKGVEWSDGQPFTCTDVKFTLDTLIANAPDMNQSSYFKEWTKQVTCTDDYSVVIDLNKPFARYMYPLVVGWEYHVAIVPEHIWKGQDPKKFTFFDLAKGWPVFTGPYKLVATSGTQVVMDRRDSWWAVKTGFQKQMPAPERIIVIPFGNDTAMAEKYITNQIDYGGPLLIGTYLSAAQKNPKLVPWFKDGKVRGAPDGCLYQLELNNDLPLFKDKNVRLALNYATDRKKLVDLAYLGSTHPAVVPFSSYISNWVTGDLKAAIDSYDRVTPSAQKVEQYMTAAGYKKNGSGIWEKDGKTAKFTIVTPDWLAPIGPVLTQQYTDAGFDVTESPDRTNAYGNALVAGTFEATVFIFCGSTFDPYDTLQYYQSKFYAPIGTKALNGMAGWRYKNPAMDAAVLAMEGMIPNKDDAKYMTQVVAATKIYLEDMPDIILAEELHVIPGNYTYWKGYPNSDDPYVAPFPCWRDIFLMTLKLQPATN
ncbi:MAG: ABC transporter substrate-binding protein [Chloroflexi bacterium]|nr:ABC transporter substrate-binding protein [Chloroflexota bacterium]MCL5275218.1 ABC transporter substrate-binding protein [Chloroflexota bacterium]